MRIVDRFFRKVGAGLINADKVTKFNYETETITTIETLINSLNSIQKILEYAKTNNYIVNIKLNKELLKSIEEYNKLIENEILRIRNHGIFNTNNNLKEERKLNQLYLNDLSSSKIEFQLNDETLMKIIKSVKTLSFFKNRLIAYLNRDN